MKIWVCLFLIFFNTQENDAQIQALVYLSSKDTNNSYLALSPESINRKLKYSIPIDSRDYTIEHYKISSIKELSSNIQSVNWLNGILVETTQENYSKLISLSFVDSVKILSYKDQKVRNKSTNKEEYTEAQYGRSYNQIQLHQGKYLHDFGATGKNMKIAVLDAGFNKLDSIYSMKKVFDEGRIHPIKNIVYNSDTLFGYSSHGTQVMGCMASYILDTCIGSAPDADYYLFITEDNRSESQVEEVNWAIAAQMADSIGVDIINSSLGYTTFNDTSTNHTYQELNGATTIVSKAAQIACNKGIVVVNSAGNEGASSWHFISAPADVPDVVSVGAVNSNGDVTSFSGRGYTSTGVIKPTVMSLGANTLLYYNQGEYYYGNGTSFASPLMAGLIACYWQANPNMSPAELRRKLIAYSSYFTRPNPDYGFGIPNFQQMMDNRNQVDTSNFGILKTFPVPFNHDLIIEYRAFDSSILDSAKIEIYNFDKLIFNSTQAIKKGYNQFFVDLSLYPAGYYFLKFKYKTSIIEKKLEKNF